MVSLYGTCDFCETVGCKKYCKSDKSPSTCEDTFKSWLNMEHTEPLPFPIGTMVEVSQEDSTWLGYYNGIRESGTHSVCTYKENIGKTCYGIPQGTMICALNQIKKVGD